MGEIREVRLPAAWIGAAAAVAVLAWIPVLLLGERSIGWLGLTAGVAVGCGAFVVAAVLTPPDVLSQFMLAIPLIVLYELGIWLSGFVAAHSRAPDADQPASTGPGDPR